MRVSTKPTTKSNVRKETLTKVLGHETVYKGVDTAEKKKTVSVCKAGNTTANLSAENCADFFTEKSFRKAFANQT